MRNWKVQITRYRGKKVPCITFGKWNGEIFQLESSMILSNGWIDLTFTCLSDEIDIEEGR